MAQRATVAIRRAASYGQVEVQDGVAGAISDLGGWDRLVKPGDRVLVKPNCIIASPAEQAAQTHPALILEVCRQLRDFGARPFVGDSPAWGSLEAVLGRLGVLPGLAGLGVPVVPFRHPVRVENPRGHVFHRLTVDRAALDADAIVNLPKFKAHRQVLLTVALKNMFGCVNGRRKAWWHVKAGSYDNYFARMLVDTYELLRPVVTILDAIVAMEGKGPISGKPRHVGLILASADGPALERVAVELVGVDPADMRTLQAATELGVGVTDLDRIDLIGPSLEEVRVSDFELPPLMPIGFSIPRFVRGSFKQVWLTRVSRPASAEA